MTVILIRRSCKDRQINLQYAIIDPLLLVLHRYEILADIPITDKLDRKRADILSRSDIIYKPSQVFYAHKIYLY